MTATASWAALRHSFRSAGYAATYFVAIVDADRRIVRRLSGRFETLDEAWQRRAWLRRRHHRAVIVRLLTMQDILE